MQTTVKKIDFANTLRGFAALTVVIGHYFGVFWFNRKAVTYLTNTPELPFETHATPIYVTWLNKVTFFNWGAYGVALFFLVSGFVIPFSLQKGNSTAFCINRICRILPTYAVGFSITLLVLFAGAKYFHTEWPYNTQEILIHYLPGIRDIMWSRNIDGIIWTLEIEMKFYLVAALAIIKFRRYSITVFLIPVVFFLLTYYLTCTHLPIWEKNNASAWQLTMTYIASSQYIIFMFIGVAFHYLYCNKIDLTKGYSIIGGLFALFCIDWSAGPYSSSFAVSWNYVFALLTFMFAYSFPQYFRANPLFNFLANISYPLYVIHGVVGYIILRILLDMGCSAKISLILVIGIIFSLSWLLHLLVERPTQAFGKKLGTKLNNLFLLILTMRKVRVLY